MNTDWFRSSVYDAGLSHHWCFHYFSLLFIASAVAVGGAAHAWGRRPAVTPLAGVDPAFGTR